MSLSEESRALIAQGREALSPTAEQSARIRSGLSARLAGAAVVTTGTLAATSGNVSAATATTGLLTKAIVVSVLVVTTAAGVSYHHARNNQQSLTAGNTMSTLAVEPTRSPDPLPSPNAQTTLSTPASAAQQPSRPAVDAVIRRIRQRPRQTVSNAWAGTSGDPRATRLGAETALLERARAAIDAQQFDRARRLLKRYRRAFPQGQLRQEASRLAVLSGATPQIPDPPTEHVRPRIELP